MEKSVDIALNVRKRDFSFFRSFLISVITFLLAVSPLFGKLSPFSAAAIGVLNGFDCIFAFFGAVIGFASTGSFELAIPHIAAMAVITALRLIFGERKNTALNIAMSAAAGICIFVANLPAAQEVSDVFTGFAFAVTAFISVLALNTAVLYKDKPITDENHFLILSGAVIYTLTVTAFSGLQAELFNAGIFISAVCVVLAPYIRDGLSSKVGILSAVGITVAENGFSKISLVLALGSLISAYFGRYSKLTRACGLIFTMFTGVLILGISTYSTVAAASVFFGAIAAVFIPDRLIPTLKNRCCASVSDSDRPFYNFGLRLCGMGEAIGEMNDAIRKTAKTLDNENLSDPSQIYITAANEICRTCKNNMYCWGSCYNRSADIMNKAVESIRKGVIADESMLTGHFSEICFNRRELAACLNRNYSSYSAAKAAARKIGEMRNVLSSQLSASERMLKSVSEELCSDSTPNNYAARDAEDVLRENGIKNPSVSVINIDGRLTVDAYGTTAALFNPSGIEKKLAAVLGKEFDPPLIYETNNKIHLTMSERSLLDAQIKTFSKSKTAGDKSGDCFDCFNDGKGSVYMILSDGMGSGSRARIDSAFSCGMLSKMLKAGIDFSAAMEMLNTSLMVKSADESFATLDVCRINLYTGEISLYKAGSASTFVRCGKSFEELAGSGVPFGVSFSPEYSESRFTVGLGDVIIMTSDGADIDKEWLSRLIMRDKNPDLNVIIGTIGEALRLSAEKGNEDDITVIGVKITK